MEVEFVELSGFRGFRLLPRLDFPSGFAIMSGRNGTGKSTICDAIEFAITGTIDKYRFKESGTESLSDYLWFRGNPAVEQNFVRVGFIDQSGPFIIERTRDSGLRNMTEGDVLQRFTSPQIAPESALQQLCQTSILRDELISAMTLDLKGTELFQQVSNALGGIGSSKYEQKAGRAVAAASQALKGANQNYEALRSHLEDALADLTRLRDSSLAIADIAGAIKAIETALPGPTDDTSNLLGRARAKLAQSRSNLDALSRLAIDARDVTEKAAAIRTKEFLAHKAEVEARLMALRGADTEAQAKRAESEKLIRQQRELNRAASDLSLLIETGRRIGLIHEQCPLCATSLNRDAFERGIEHSERRLKEIGGTSIQVERDLSDSSAPLAALREKRIETEQEAALLDRETRTVEDRERDITLRFAELGYSVIQPLNVPEITQRIAKDRDQLADLDRATRILEASQSISLLTEQEGRVSTLRASIQLAEEKFARYQRIEQQFKDISSSVIRTRNEMRAELLAQIGPLLDELYQRLNPHIDWRTIEYKLRGDVRRFLTLRVGDDLNSQFIFSSGQRRAAGLAFLLSVFLSRQWSSWKTLILDDPVQHIDDYRALNLIEILSAIRRDGRQLICTAEDDALAILLSRRLRSTATSPGARFHFDLDVDGNLAVIKQEAIPPMAARVLVSDEQTGTA